MPEIFEHGGGSASDQKIILDEEHAQRANRRRNLTAV
jgi:hypothetical protein